MFALPTGPTQLVKQLLEQTLRAGDMAVDATAGNGHDSLTLARCVGQTGRIWAVDIQAEAIEATRQLLGQAGQLSQVTLWQGSHDQLMAELPELKRVRLSALVFNLGYLPGADQQLITQPASTLRALESLTPLLREGGLCALTLYTGHPGGAAEAQAVEEWAQSLPRKHWLCWRSSLANVSATAPYSLILQRLSSG